MLQSSQHSAEQPSAFYRFYLLRADDHFARRREDYFADDAAAIGAAKHVIGDFSGVEIWCGARKVITLSREAVAELLSSCLEHGIAESQVGQSGRQLVKAGCITAQPADDVISCLCC